MTMSFWKLNRTKHYEALKEHINVDTLIIGGGMVGLNTLYLLKDADVILVEANEIGSGVSQNTTGKLNYLQENTLYQFWKRGAEAKAVDYLSAQLEGIELLKKIIKQENISCNLEEVTSYLVTRDANNIADLQRFRVFLEKQGIKVTEDISSITESFLYGIGVDRTYVFHPVKYMLELASRIPDEKIYEHTRILQIECSEDCYYCYTDQNYCIRAHHVVLACHYPFFLFPFFLPLKTSIEKSYLAVREVPKNLKYTYITLESPSMSSRFYQDEEKQYQIFLGSSHDTSTKQNDALEFQKFLETFSLDEKEILCSWSNVDLLTSDFLPFVGEIKPNLYLATGFQTWGMVQSVVSAYVIQSLLKQQENPYQKLFEPRRETWQHFLSLPGSIFRNAKSFVGSKFYHKSWYSSQLRFFFDQGRLIAVYKDEKGEHLVHPVCPHLKCGLIFNEVDKTWDCPCHSSRFDLDGHCLKGPAKYSITYKPGS